MELDDYTLARLKQLAQNATPGPWRWGTGEENDGDWPERYLVTVAEFKRISFTLNKVIFAAEDSPDGWDNPENAPYLAALTPEVVLELIAGYILFRHNQT